MFIVYMKKNDNLSSSNSIISLISSNVLQLQPRVFNHTVPENRSTSQEPDLGDMTPELE